MRKQTIYGLLFFANLAFCLSATSSAIAASAEEEVLQVIINQDKAMNTSDIELLSSLWWHSPKTSFFGPVINCFGALHLFCKRLTSCHAERL